MRERPGKHGILERLVHKSVSTFDCVVDAVEQVDWKIEFAESLEQRSRCQTVQACQLVGERRRCATARTNTAARRACGSRDPVWLMGIAP